VPVPIPSPDVGEFGHATAKGAGWSYEVKFNGYRIVAGGRYYEGRKLMFASKLRAGLTPHVRAELFPMLKPLQHSSAPFVNLPSSRTGHWGEAITADDMTTLQWVKPKIVVEVSFVEWTRDGLLRHPCPLATSRRRVAARLMTSGRNYPDRREEW
jgi:ATP-dependent DNA ligase